MLTCILWKIKDHIYGAVKWSSGKDFLNKFGKGICRRVEPGQEGKTEEMGIGGGWGGLDQHVWTLATSGHSWGQSLPRPGAPGSCGLLPLHHTQVALTHHPPIGSQTGSATSQCPVIKKESHLMLGPGLLSAIKTELALFFLAFLPPDEFSIFPPCELSGYFFL